MTRKYHTQEEKHLVSNIVYLLNLKMIPMIIAKQEELERIITEVNLMNYSEYKKIIEENVNGT